MDLLRSENPYPPLTVGSEISGKGFVGRVSQLHIFSEDSVNSAVQKCFNDITGDILSWKQFEDILSNDVLVHLPSECDDTNECDSNPCLNGNCTDKLNSYECRCFYGFYGDQCDNSIDDCGDNACDNNGTCIDGAASYECDCPPNFTGKLCEIKMVDGEWGEWGNWTSCSVSCGNGTTTRIRQCNDPTPDNGGKECEGNNTEYDSCMEEECPVCPTLTGPENAILNCNNDTSTDTVNCTLQCLPGYAFDHDPKDYYYCGPDTLHQWDIQTEENPLFHLPSCSELNNASGLRIEYTANYADLICGFSAKVDDAGREIKEVVNKASLNAECIINNTCKVSKLEVINCTEYSREKRDLFLEKAGFQIQFECNSEKYGSKQCHGWLLDAFESMVNQTTDKLLDSVIDNTVYPIEPSSLFVDSDVICSEGFVAVDYRCVPCTKGRYAQNGSCELCDIGLYQDETGQSVCKTCPIGKSTLGKGSINVIECTVETNTILKDAINGTLIGLACAFSIFLFVVLACILRRNLRKDPKIKDYDVKDTRKRVFSRRPVFETSELRVYREQHHLPNQ